METVSGSALSKSSGLPRDGAGKMSGFDDIGLLHRPRPAACAVLKRKRGERVFEEEAEAETGEDRLTD
jgi:hypothetical protein